MYTFTHSDLEFTLSKDSIPMNSLLSELVELSYTDKIEIECITQDEFKVIANYFNHGTIPTIDQYHIFEYMRIDTSSYELSMVITNHLRNDMSNARLDSNYGLRILTKEFWNELDYSKKMSFKGIYHMLRKLDSITELGNILITVDIDKYHISTKCIYVYIYGCDSKTAGIKLVEIAEIAKYKYATRTEDFVSFVTGDKIDIRISLDIYQTKSEILHSIGNNRFGYDGKNILMTRNTEYILIYNDCRKKQPNYRLDKEMCIHELFDYYLDNDDCSECSECSNSESDDYSECSECNECSTRTKCTECKELSKCSTCNICSDCGSYSNSNKYTTLIGNVQVSELFTNNILKSKVGKYVRIYNDEYSTLSNITKIDKSIYELVSIDYKWEIPRVLKWNIHK